MFSYKKLQLAFVVTVCALMALQTCHANPTKEDEKNNATTAKPTTIAPTTVKPTTLAPTTEKPTTPKVTTTAKPTIPHGHTNGTTHHGSSVTNNGTTVTKKPGTTEKPITTTKKPNGSFQVTISLGTLLVLLMAVFAFNY